MNNVSNFRTDGSSALQPEYEQDEDKSDGKKTQQATLMGIAAHATLFKTPEGALCARFPVEGHHETWIIGERGGGFRN
jgi:hypothetical protein